MTFVSLYMTYLPFQPWSGDLGQCRGGAQLRRPPAAEPAGDQPAEDGEAHRRDDRGDRDRRGQVHRDGGRGPPRVSEGTAEAAPATSAAPTAAGEGCAAGEGAAEAPRAARRRGAGGRPERGAERPGEVVDEPGPEEAKPHADHTAHDADGD